MKITVPKVAENHNRVAVKVVENHGKVTEKLREKAAALGETLTANRVKILELVIKIRIYRELT